MNAASEIMFLTLLIIFIAKGTSGTGEVPVPACSGTLVEKGCPAWENEYRACSLGDGTTVIDFAVVAELWYISTCEFFDGNYLDYNSTNGVYGYTKNILWVDNGCQATFYVCLVQGCPGTLTRVSCSSLHYEYAECVVPGSVIYATIYDKQSNSVCNSKGNSPSPIDYSEDRETTGIYGYQYDTLWVNNGCQAEFEVCFSATCIIRGDPHVETADNTTYIFGGVGFYYLIYEQTENIIIIGQFSACRPKHQHVSCLYALNLKINIGYQIETEIRMVRGRILLVDGEHKELPYKSDDGLVKIFEVNEEIKIEFVKLCIVWDGIKKAILKPPIYFAGLMKGLCGTYDFNTRNDFMLREGTVSGNVSKFGNSWKVE